MKDKYTIQNYVEDLRTAVALAATEAEILRKVRPLAQKLVINRGAWLKPEYYEVDLKRGSSLYVLHEEEDHTLMVFAACFRPGRVTPIHDHGTWAVVAGVEGEEKNTYVHTYALYNNHQCKGGVTTKHVAKTTMIRRQTNTDTNMVMVNRILNVHTHGT